MFWRRIGNPTFMERIAQQCEYFLVEAAEQKAQATKWSVTSRTGQVYDATLIVDEWTDTPVVELSDPETGEVVRRFFVAVNCWLAQ